MTNSTAFLVTDNSLTAEGLLDPDGVIKLIDRDDQTFAPTTPLEEIVANDGISDQSLQVGTGNLIVKAPVKNDPFITAANTAPTIALFNDFTSASEATTAWKTIAIADANSDTVTVVLHATAGTITVTGARGGVITDNTTDEVTVTGAAVWGNITITFIAPVGATSVTVTGTVTDTYGEYTSDTATITVSAP